MIRHGGRFMVRFRFIAWVRDLFRVRLGLGLVLCLGLV